jgi:hypothetical protein
MYYIMPQRIDMRLMMTQTVPRKPRNDTTNANMNTMLQSSQQRLSSFGGNVFNGNMNGVFAARGRPCG